MHHNDSKDRGNTYRDTSVAVSLIFHWEVCDVALTPATCLTDVQLRTSPEHWGSFATTGGHWSTYSNEWSLYVVKGNYVVLFGREWLHKIKLNWKEIKLVPLNTLEQKYAIVFSKELGEMRGIQANVSLKLPKTANQNSANLKLCLMHYDLR